MVDNGVTVVGMESTGSYWKPVYYLLRYGGHRAVLLNAQHVKTSAAARPSAGCQWICQLVEHGRSGPASSRPGRSVSYVTDRYRTETARIAHARLTG